MALLDDGDEVIVPAPCWVSYPEIVTMAGGKPVLVDTAPEDDYQLALDVAGARRDAEDARDRAQLAVQPDRRGLRRGDRWRRSARVLREHRTSASSPTTSTASWSTASSGCRLCRVAPELADRVLLVDGVSKTYAMTGWRIGFTAGPTELIKAMDTLQGQSTTNPAAIAQAAALAALTGPQDSVAAMRAEFDERRREMVDGLRAIPKVKLPEPRARSTASPTSAPTSAASSRTTWRCASGSSRRGASRWCPARASSRPASCACRTPTSMARR